jgi:hypothetical protein
MFGSYMSPANNYSSYNSYNSSTSYAGANTQYGVGSALGLAFSSVQDAKNNYNNAVDNALNSGNYWNLPSGTHILKEGYNRTTIVKNDKYMTFKE